MRVAEGLNSHLQLLGLLARLCALCPEVVAGQKMGGGMSN